MESIFCELLTSGKRPEIFSRSTNQSNRKVNTTTTSGTHRGNKVKNQIKKTNKSKPINQNQ